MNIRLATGPALVIAVALAGMVALGDRSAAAVDIKGQSWTVTEIAGEPLSSAATARVDFGGDGKLNAFAGCNQLFGAYKAEADALAVSQVGSTRKLCAKPIMATERALASALRQATKIIETPDGVALTDGTAVVLKLAPQN